MIMKTSQEIEEICKKLKPIIGTEADQLWYMYLSEDETARRKLVLDIEILAEKLLKQNALTPQEILLTPPSVKDASGTFLLGDVIYNRENFYPLSNPIWKKNFSLENLKELKELIIEINL